MSQVSRRLEVCSIKRRISNTRPSSSTSAFTFIWLIRFRAISTVMYPQKSSQNCIQAHSHGTNTLLHINLYFSERLKGTRGMLVCLVCHAHGGWQVTFQLKKNLFSDRRRMSFFPPRRHRGPLHRTRGKACQHQQRAPTRTLDQLPVCSASRCIASTSACQLMSSRYVRRTCLSMRRAASMLRACCDCFYCASAGADLAPDATVRARAAN